MTINSPTVKSLEKGETMMRTLRELENQDANNALHLAIKNNDLDGVKTLISAGVDPESGKDGMSALHLAVKNNHLDIVEFLVEQNVLLERTYHDKTPLMQAVSNNNIEIAECLLNAGANVHLVEAESNLSIVHVAYYHNNLDMIKLLVSKNADFDKCNSYHENILTLATNAGNVQMVKFLVEAGCILNYCNDDSSDNDDPELYNNIELCKEMIAIADKINDGAYVSPPDIDPLLVPLCIEIYKSHIKKNDDLNIDLNSDDVCLDVRIKNSLIEYLDNQKILFSINEAILLSKIEGIGIGVPLDKWILQVLNKNFNINCEEGKKLITCYQKLAAQDHDISNKLGELLQRLKDDNKLECTSLMQELTTLIPEHIKPGSYLTTVKKQQIQDLLYKDIDVNKAFVALNTLVQPNEYSRALVREMVTLYDQYIRNPLVKNIIDGQLEEGLLEMLKSQDSSIEDGDTLLGNMDFLF